MISKNFDKCRIKQSPFKLRNTRRIFKRLANALIRLRVWLCAGWSKALLVATDTTLFLLILLIYVKVNNYKVKAGRSVDLTTLFPG